MNRPYLTRMIVFVALGLGVAAFLFTTLIDAFLANPALNGLIIAVLLLGIGYIFRQVVLLQREQAWLERFGEGGLEQAQEQPTRLLAPMAKMLADRRTTMSLSTLSMRTLLDAVGVRLDESRELSRYLIGLLIFLGLLGTFWGLLQTVSSIRDVIAGLEVESADLAATFDALKSGLEHPLGGMGTAFSSSLFGLAGSLVLGFLDLQAGQAQNRFYNEFEEWLSGHTRLSSGGMLSEGEQAVPAYVGALLERTADSLDELQRAIARGEEARAAASSHFALLSDRLATLIDQMRTEQDLMVRLAETQVDMRRLLQRLTETPREAPPVDEVSQAHLRNLDVYMTRLVDETIAGRTQLINELRGELRMLARTIAGSAEEARRR